MTTSMALQPSVWARIQPEDPTRTGRWMRDRVRAAPGRARGRSSPLRPRAAAEASASPTGTLIQKIQCQVLSWMTAPPTSGPRATAKLLIPLFFDFDTVLLRREGVAGASAVQWRHDRAADAPQGRDGHTSAGRQRRSGRGNGEQDDPESEPAKRARSGRRAQRRSAAAPRRKGRRRLTTYTATWIVACRSRWMLGSATLTMRLSRTTMKRPTDTSTSVQDATARCNGFCGWHGVRSLA